MKMTANRRIFLNIAATYARSLYTLALGLVTARWLLLSLGQTDYGLFGVVGGLVAFVVFFNRLFSSAVSRFYAVAIGQAKRTRDRTQGIAECQRWFTAAVSVHTVLPLALVAAGYPVGVYAIDHWLVIPPDRLAACVWVWRFSCLSALTAMVNVPFRAMYTAKQEIAERTVYSLLSSTLNAVLLYYMVTHPGDWLAKYALLHCLIGILPRACICLGAIVRYPECRLRADCLWNWRDIRQLASFAGWTVVGTAGQILRVRGMQILVNLMMGPAQNAAMTVATRLAGRSNTFSASLAGAFSPAIMSAYGAGNRARMMGLVFRVCKLAGLLVACASLPLVLEVNEVMRLWLKHPPAESPLLCAFVLAQLFTDKLTTGLHAAVVSTGRIAVYQFLCGVAPLAALPLAWALMRAGLGLVSVGIAFLAASCTTACIRVVMSRAVAGVDIVHWARAIVLPILATMVVAALVGMMPRHALPPSFWRVVLTVVSVESVMLPLGWFVVLDVDERAYVVEKSAKVWRRLRGGA